MFENLSLCDLDPFDLNFTLCNPPLVFRLIISLDFSFINLDAMGVVSEYISRQVVNI